MMRSVVVALLIFASAFATAACDTAPTARSASSWTVQVMSKGAPVASTPVKITFLQDVKCEQPPCLPQSVGIAEGTTDAQGSITVPMNLNGFGGDGSGRADKAQVWIANRGITTVAISATTVDVPPAAQLAPPASEPPTPSAPSAPPAQPPWRLKLTSKGAPLANTAVNVRLLQRVQCVAAPCNPQQVGNASATTDAEGNATIAIDPMGMGKPDQAEITVAGHATVTTGVGTATVDVP